MGNNTEHAAALADLYDPTNSLPVPVPVRFGAYATDIGGNVTLDIAGLTLMVDNATSPVPGLSVMLVRGYALKHLSSLPNEGHGNFSCDLDFFEHMTDETAWRCDFDDDSCAEYENQSSVSYSLLATFSFKNTSASVNISSSPLPLPPPFPSPPPSPPTLVPIPDEILLAMETSSGADVLNISLAGSIIVNYQINNRSMGAGFGGDCGSDWHNISASIPVSVNRSFAVAGRQKLFFLSAPVLREQWARNNKFNVIVLSQSSLSSVSFLLANASHLVAPNGSAPGRSAIENTTDLINMTIPTNTTNASTKATAINTTVILRTFSVVTNKYGVQEIVSTSVPDFSDGYLVGMAETKNSTNPITPIQLERSNNSFAYAYQFNWSYGQFANSAGAFNVSMVVNDSFLGSATYNEALVSRFLSYNNDTSELGWQLTSDSGPQNLFARPSMPAPQDRSLSPAYAVTGLVALLIVLVFIDFGFGAKN